MTKPVAGKSSYAGTQLASGDYAIIDLNVVEDGDPQKIDEAQKLSIKRNLVNMQGQSDFGNLLSTLKAESKIQIQQNNL